MKKIRVISCVTTVMIMALIFFFSSQNSEESSAVSKSFTVLIVEKVVAVFTEDSVTIDSIVNAIHNLIRKMAHFTIYTSLGISSFTMIYSNLKKTKLKTIIYTVVFCCAYAVTDEIHQLFIAGRSGNIKDVFIDTSGAFFGALICIAVMGIACMIIKRRGR